MLRGCARRTRRRQPEATPTGPGQARRKVRFPSWLLSFTSGPNWERQTGRSAIVQCGALSQGDRHIAPHYNEIGANLFVADYRGFGASGGSPSFNTILSDAHEVLDWLQETMRALRFTGPLYVMGRSMGRHSAGELAINAADRVNGVIIESGRPNLGRIAEGQEPAVVQALEDDYQAKFYSIDIPALVIHGQWDESAPLADAVDMFNKLETAHKHLEIIPGAGHNDLMYVGFRQYFNAIKGFMARYAGPSAAIATTSQTTE